MISNYIFLETSSFPKTTTKRCSDCSKSGFATDENEDICAESDVDNSHYDVCGGDSGGISMNSLYFDKTRFHLKLGFHNEN